MNYILLMTDSCRLLIDCMQSRIKGSVAKPSGADPEGGGARDHAPPKPLDYHVI